MEKFNKIIKQTLVFLVIFLVINYIFSFFNNPEKEALEQSGNLVFITSDDNYSRSQIVTLEIDNNTKEEITIPNECPNEPFKVYRYQNNEWVQKTSAPELDCSKTQDFILKPGEDTKISYGSWNHALFSELGRFKIEFETTLNGEKKTITTNEFTVVKEGIFSQLWTGLIYRPIYNALIFFTSILPGHDLGWAIILLTILIRTLLLAPSQKAMKAQKKMQEVQPKLNAIKEKYKGDQQRIAMETMALWKEAKVSPMGSCLPLLLQIPFLIAIFYVTRDGLNPDNTFLLYKQYTDFAISDINPIFLGILDLRNIEIFVLPLLVGALQFLQMKLSMARNTKKDQPQNEFTKANNMMLYFMPVMLAVFAASFPAGVAIYTATSTIYGIIQQIIVNRSSTDSKKDDEPTVRVIEKKDN